MDCHLPPKKDKEEDKKVIDFPLLVEVEERTLQTRTSTNIDEESRDTWETAGKKMKKEQKGICYER